MRPSLLFAVTIAVTACTSPPDVSQSAQRPQSAQPQLERARQPDDEEATREREIYIDSIEIANPVIVTGRARTFENNVVLRARAEDGTLITETFTTSEGEMGHHNPYRAELWITRDAGSRITVEALEYSARDGSERSLVAAERPFRVEPIDVELYFPNDGCTQTPPYPRRLPKSVAMARLLVEALIAGPTAEEKMRGAASPFPAGSRVESINLRDGVATVDFNERLRNVGGSCRAQMIRAAVTRTLRELPAIDKIVITAAGSEALALQP